MAAGQTVRGGEGRLTGRGASEKVARTHAEKVHCSEIYNCTSTKEDGTPVDI